MAFMSPALANLDLRARRLQCPHPKRSALNKILSPLLLLASVLGVSCSSLLAAPVASDSPPPPLNLQGQYLRPYWYVPVTINGSSYQFLVDTGAGVDIIGMDLSLDLGKPVGTAQLSGLSGGNESQVYRAPQGRIAGVVPLSTGIVLRVDLSEMSRRVGRKVDGVLGMSTIGGYAWRLNPDTGELTVALRANQFDLSTYEWAPLVNRARSPTIVVDFPGNAKVPVTIDTGFNGFLALKVADFNGLRERGAFEKTGFQQKTRTMFGELSLDVVQLKSLEVLGHRFTSYFVTGPHDLSLAGMELFRRFDLILDFNGERIYFKRARGIDEAQIDRPLGVGVESRGTEIVIQYAEDTGTLDTSALRVGDIVREVNATPISTEYEFAAQIAARQSPTVKVERNGEMRTVTLRPKR